MKLFNLILFVFVLASCSSKKQVVENAPKTTPDVTVVAKPIAKEIPKTPEVAVAAGNNIAKGAENVVKAGSNEISKTVTEIKDNKEELVEHVKEDAMKAKEALKKQAEQPVIPETPKTVSHKIFNTLLQKYVTPNGNVNYIGFKQNHSKLRSYITLLGKNVPDDSWSRNETLAYWINAYNALTIDLILRKWPVKSIKDIDKPWDQRFWKLGTKWYNLGEIEHSILRKMDDPRIHFAIVCASYSCPKLQNKTFEAKTMNAQLADATKTFVNDSKRNTISSDSVEISKIFQWFAKDFKQNGSVIDFINAYSDVKIASNAKKRYKEYNWNLND